ncbi:hypothetical protein CWI42_100570 [Ordospora colligata]|uniref:Uncharacterized protein n=1 Tax=Ordospora colligata OC4 TaxID=1354746 RepID=A0A0B2UIK6_9MICR|nr:uncharacterized protein M896_100580 [Ordospora colligata OC4]KHN69074.1 hypothetical protein M896_100580 [Ordospora colligata OC4]TBU14355.1 hypothetical protein CWI40_100590 [Ordospora colligata]TBU14420.1 hypothetical protein CWI41_100590 [Ordospora colligata]TBU17936.1 hypothetical protein CWI42_100570 [Ordospora colligata]
MFALLFAGHVLASKGDDNLVDNEGSINWGVAIRTALHKTQDRTENALILLFIGLFINFAGIRMKKLSFFAIFFCTIWVGIDTLRNYNDMILKIRYKGLFKNATTLFKLCSKVVDMISNNIVFTLFLSLVSGVMFLYVFKIVAYLMILYLGICAWNNIGSIEDTSSSVVVYYAVQIALLIFGIIGMSFVDPIAVLMCTIVFSIFGSVLIILGLKFGLGVDLDIEEFVKMFALEDAKIGDNEIHYLKFLYAILVILGIINQIFFRKKKA